MYTLGIESTAHTFGVGILKDSKVVANARKTYKPEGGGLVPREAVDFFLDHAYEIYQEALDTAKITSKDLDLITFAKGPGMAPCLKAGAVCARMLAQTLDIPLIGANHCVGHVEIGKLTSGFKDPVVLYVSGGNTQILALEAGRYRVFGETLDAAIGKCLDHFARNAGLEHPGGPKIEKLAREGKELLPMPYTVKGMDFSFSGTLTAASKLLETESLEDVCFSLQEYAFAMLTEATERAIAHTQKSECLLTGGVAANKRLQGMLDIMCRERGASFQTVPFELAGDNGAMIAYTGYLMHKAGIKHTIEDTYVDQNFRTDQVEVVW